MWCTFTAYRLFLKLNIFYYQITTINMSAFNNIMINEKLISIFWFHSHYWKLILFLRLFSRYCITELPLNSDKMSYFFQQDTISIFDIVNAKNQKQKNLCKAIPLSVSVKILHKYLQIKQIIKNKNEYILNF